MKNRSYDTDYGVGKRSNLTNTESKSYPFVPAGGKVYIEHHIDPYNNAERETFLNLKT
jgi:hypothetical protein